MTASRYYINNNTTSSSNNSSNSSSTSISSTSISTTAAGSSKQTQPGVLTEDQWEELATYYEKCIGASMTMPLVYEIKDYNERYGIGYDVIRIAIRETALARWPSPRYMLAILERCAGDEITTAEEWRAARAEFKARKKVNYER